MNFHCIHRKEVDEGVDVSGRGEDPEEKLCCAYGRSCGQEDCGEKNTWENVLDVVEVGATNAFNIGVAYDDLTPFYSGGVFGIGKSLLKGCLSNSEICDCIHINSASHT